MSSLWPHIQECHLLCEQCYNRFIKSYLFLRGKVYSLQCLGFENDRRVINHSSGISMESYRRVKNHSPGEFQESYLEWHNTAFWLPYKFNWKMKMKVTKPLIDLLVIIRSLVLCLVLSLMISNHSNVIHNNYLLNLLGLLII